MDNNTYKLIGVLNILEIYPQFSWCIFEKNGKLYSSNCKENEIEINYFKIVNIDFNKIKLINEENFKLLELKTDYKVGDNIPIALRRNKKNYVIGDIKYMVYFLKNYNPKEDIDKNNLPNINKEKLFELLKKDINYFIYKYENKINYLKIEKCKNNFDETNIENLSNQRLPNRSYSMWINESENEKAKKVSDKSREILAKKLIKN